MKVTEKDADFCEVCGRVIPEGGKHLESKHLSGRYARLHRKFQNHKTLLWFLNLTYRILGL